ncbi:MAG: hypothetical protein WKF84_18685 [Pyrinomonadaceae bacterium]
MRNGDFTDTTYLDGAQFWLRAIREAHPCNDAANLGPFCAGVNRIVPSAFDPGGQVLTSLLPLPNIDPEIEQQQRLQLRAGNRVQAAVLPIPDSR